MHSGTPRLALIAAISVVAFTMLTACSKDSSPAEAPSPAAVTQQFYEDMDAGKLEPAKAFLTPESAVIIQRVAEGQGLEAFRFDAEATRFSERIHGDTAVVSMEVPGKPPSSVSLVKLDGQWKIDFASMLNSIARDRVPAAARDASSN